MSYARFGDDSDVYVFIDGETLRLECCACLLRERLGHFQCRTRVQMLAHLEKHRAKGHKVPRSATMRLRRELEQGRRKRCA